MPDYDHAEYLRRERRAEKDAALIFTPARQTGDIEIFDEAVDQINQVSGWLVAMRKVAREVRVVSPVIQSAFQLVWTKSKTLSLRVGDHRALCDAARLFLPKYTGPAVRLYRGAGASERRRRIYGLSWSADVKTADQFALERRVMDGGSVLLETLASPEAIISQIDYPQPFTQNQIDEFRSRNPEVVIEEFHEEREYVVDRRHLNAVSVRQRYEQSHHAAPPPPSVFSSGS